MWDSQSQTGIRILFHSENFNFVYGDICEKCWKFHYGFDNCCDWGIKKGEVEDSSSVRLAAHLLILLEEKKRKEKKSVQ